jgi:plastocyanin
VRRNPLIPLVVCALALAIGLGACGGDDDEDETTPVSEVTTEQEGGAYGGGGSAAAGGGETVEITATEFAFDPAEVTAKAGEVTFALRNDGSAEHNLEVEGNGIEEVSDTIGGGKSTELAVELEPGTYEMYCAIDGHKDLGMEGEITVE